MPELPEVEIICRSIKSYLVGKNIAFSIVRNMHLRWMISSEICTIKDEIIVNVYRRAKYLLLELTNGWIIIHLGMSGNLRILSEYVVPKKHDHIDLVMNDGKVLRYNDPRRFGAWLWSKNLEECNVLKFLGPEPLTEEFNADYLKERCMQRKSTIKPYLMNSRLVVGIGNIYANESLFSARINPYRLASSLSQMECRALTESIKKILNSSIEYGGTTLKNFLQTDGRPGFFIKKLQVYGRKNESCLVCGALLLVDKQAQRTTFYCYKCQK